MTEPIRFQCGTCNEWHEGLPHVAFAAPTPYLLLTDTERAAIASMTADTCSIGGEDFFVRGVIELPILGTEEVWGIGVWVSLSRRNFERYIELFRCANPQEGPYFGWLSNSIPLYPETGLLRTTVHLRPAPARPAITLESTDHPLAVHQREGIPLHDVQRLVELSLHGERLAAPPGPGNL